VNPCPLRSFGCIVKVGYEMEKSLDAISPVSVRSVDQVVYESLREEILRGLTAGTPLRLRDLATRFSTSTMPVRAALAQLQSDGLVVQEARKGATVAPFSFSDFHEIQVIRCGLEGIAARTGLGLISAENLDQMAEIFGALKGLDDNGPDFLEEHLRLSRALHDVVYEASGLPKLLEMIDNHRRYAERYLRHALDRTGEFATDVKLQGKFLEQCQAKNGDGAQKAVHDLLTWTVVRVSAALDSSRG
jgi:DNA-binding GntR family transcriptional regulator